MAIHLLDQDTINKIAAGEVIERPMAVVKELIENAIDAKANMITIEIKDGGKSLIRITDNGTGIGENDIKLAFTPHATSKINNAGDLLAVSTLGFRGEALASIASVSQMEMLTKTRESFNGYRYMTDGGEEKKFENAGCPEGTTFIIRNLFYNTPARLKFLKTAQTEAGYISGVIERMALSHPDISFKFINQNQTRLHTSGNGNLKDVIYNIYGRDIASNLIPIEVEKSQCKIHGFIGKPVISRGNRSYLNYYINGRYIKSNIVHRAVEEAYGPYSMQHRYPFTVIHFEINPEYIDVNVHPQKMEVRFTNEKELYKDIYDAVSDTLKYRELINDVSFGKEHKNSEREHKSVGLVKKPELKKEQPQVDKVKEPVSLKEQPLSSEVKERVPKIGQVSLRRPNEEEKKRLHEMSMGMISKTSEESETAQKNLTDNIIKAAQNEKKETIIKPEQNDKADNIIKSDLKDKETEIKNNEKNKIENINEVSNTDKVKEKTEYNVKNAKQQNLFESGIMSKEKEKDIKIIGQVFSTYWILQFDDCMYMVDQHAAHEKVMYERLMKQLKQNDVTVQMVQPPIVLTLSMLEQQAVEDNMEFLNSIGYNIESFGGREYMVTGVPAQLPDIATEELLMEFIDDLTQEKGNHTPEMLLDKIASMSCKAAVKGGNDLSVAQAHELLKELMQLENPYNCPHGRPTMIRMTKREIEKKFKRII